MSAAPATAILERAMQAPGGRRAVAPDDLAELVRSFTSVTERLQATHDSLRDQVTRLSAELDSANEQLRRSRELAALGEVAAGIAHEIRNPLGSIALDVGLLRSEFAGCEESRVACERVLRAVDRLDTIVGDVLRFARDLRPSLSEVDLADAVAAAIESCAAPIGTAGVRVERRLAPIILLADGHLLTQALVNLVRNAVEAMDETCATERVLRVATTVERRALSDGRRADHAVIAIEDAGPGIREDVLERIFRPFVTTRADGTGLGLAIVHRIVDAHGGNLSVRAVRDEAPRGARFEIAIPVRVEDRRRGSPDGLDAAVRRRIGACAGP